MKLEFTDTKSSVKQEYHDAYNTISKQYHSSESFIKLIRQLVHTVCLLKDDKHVQEDRVLLNLVKGIYEIIFSHRRALQKQSTNYSKVTELTTFEKLTWYTHILCRKGQFDKANRLKEHLKYLQERGLQHNNSDVSSILKFLCCLSNTKFETIPVSLSVPSPWIVLPFRNYTHWNIPRGPLNFNDTRLNNVPSQWYYTEFPSHIFHAKDPERDVKAYIAKYNLHKSNEEPGSGLNFKFFHRETENADECLGALIGPKKSPLTPDTELCIPDLPNIPEGYSFVPYFISQAVNSLTHCHSVNIYNDRTPFTPAVDGAPDEGYESSSPNITFAHNKVDVWDAVLNYSPLPHRHTWESIEKPYPSKQKPFLSEAGDEMNKNLWIINSQHISCLFTSSEYHQPCEIPLKSVCKDVIHLLMGIPSKTFFWHKGNKTFEITPGISYKGISPESFSVQAQQFITCANQIRRLEELANPLMNEWNDRKSGMILTSLMIALRNFLMAFRKELLSYWNYSGFLFLKLKTEPLRKKMQQMYDICFPRGDSKSVITSRVGIVIIGNLMSHVFAIRPASHCYLILSLLNATCKPFFRFLEKWIYEGEFYDPGCEYMVESDAAAICSRDRSYWVKGYCLNNKNLTHLPPLLREVLVQAFHCGKALNLLRTYAPLHYLQWRKGFRSPTIRLCLTLSDVESTREECDQYLQFLRGNFHFVTLKEYDDNMQNHKINLMHVAAANRIKTLRILAESYICAKFEERERKKQEWVRIKEDIDSVTEFREKQKISELEHIMRLQEEYDLMLLEERYANVTSCNELALHYDLHLVDLKSREVAALESINIDEEGKRNSLLMRESDTETLSAMSTTSDNLPTPDDEVILTSDGNHYNVPCTILQQLDNKPDNMVRPMTIDNYESTLKEVKANKLAMLSSLNQLLDFSYSKTTEKKKLKEKYGLKIAVNENDTVCDVADKNANLKSNSLETNASEEVERPTSLITDGNLKKETLESQQSRNTEGKQPRLISETFSRIHGNKDVGLDDSAGMRKSKSDFSLGKEHEEPLLVDKVGGEILRQRGRNIHGHVSDSVIPYLLSRNASDSTVCLPSEPYHDEELLLCRVVEPLCPHTPFQEVEYWLSNCQPMADIVSRGYKTDEEKEERCMPSPEQLRTAGVCIVRALSIHVSMQISLVNEALLGSLLIEESLLDHFLALKAFLLLQDMSFARSLTFSLFNKFNKIGCLPSRLLNPIDINGLLSDAIFASSHVAKSAYANNLSFIVTNSPEDTNQFSGPWNILELQYQVKWPVCIILDELILATYEKVWKFLMTLHYAMLVIDNAFHHMTSMSCNPLLEKMKGSFHFHQLSIFRYEMNHFIRVIFGYVSYQGIQRNWVQFQSDLRRKVATLDDLYAVHWDFINGIIARCFLTTQTVEVHNLLLDIFSKVVTFRNILIDSHWKYNSSTNQWEHTQFSDLQKNVEEFRKLTIRMSKLISNGLNITYCEHLDYLSNQLSFNQNFNFKTGCSDSLDC